MLINLHLYEPSFSTSYPFTDCKISDLYVLVAIRMAVSLFSGRILGRKLLDMLFAGDAFTIAL